MDSEERPTKMRKLSHDSAQADLNASASPDHMPKDGIPHTGVTTNGTQHGTGSSVGQPSGPYTAEMSAGSNVAEVENEDDVNAESGDSLPPPDATAPLAASSEVQVDENPPLSKNQQKKLRKKQEWDSKRDERKVVRKEKLVAKRERKRTARDEVRAENGEDISKPPARPARGQSAPKPAQLPITFLIDCDFDDLMRENERISLAAQITRCYSDNKNSMFRAHLTVCSFGGQLRERFDNVLSHYKGWRGVRFLDCDFAEAAEKANEWMLDEEAGNELAGALSDPAELDEAAHAKLKEEGEVVYLSSESDETLTELKPYSTYIIGGLVDKNRKKGLCYKRATQRGVRTARLPIGEFMEMQSRKVLATNHVNEIMLKWLECGDWGQAFLKVIPKRKGGRLKGAADEAEGSREDDGERSDDQGDELVASENVGGTGATGYEEPLPTAGGAAEDDGTAAVVDVP
ncbi:hypothetical protein LTR36_007548 [Oleoguttula mirabilis]|uniref:tRNA (guanine(9)-N1)-methyltransferase n=1 Tax=Oleoguttula mirabilis TaxID=1507867 RepID=A0AAV9JVH5_9PEZI|nr:hypothetical protein LTR36_007548 [Oleoguttula mirabilis]